MRIVPTAELAALIGSAPLDIDPISDLAFTVPHDNVILDPATVAAYHAANPLPTSNPMPLILLAAVCGLLAFGALIFATLASLGPVTANHAPYKRADRMPVHTSATHFAYIAPSK